MSGLGDKQAYPGIETIQHVDTSEPRHFGVPGMTYRERLFAELLAAFARGGQRSKLEAIGDALAWTDDAIAAFEAQAKTEAK